MSVIPSSSASGRGRNNVMKNNMSKFKSHMAILLSASMMPRINDCTSACFRSYSVFRKLHHGKLYTDGYTQGDV
ncbi:hypothetical protein CEXT_653901 [Caerostris extrusa]|uniref:Uncharacterized protein n=1 Tax=Caerostris extrusa TaxID=172846 RepID=A0AAV4XLY7_CAEEX|nr:hypothetical protein CEXT_653901 [Caerostris extrusa]